MKISIERGALLRVLSHVQSVVERRNTVPILSNVLIVAENDRLTITATDLDIQATETVAARIDVPGRLTVPAHTFFDIMRKMPDGSQIELSLEKAQLLITGGRARFRMPIMPAENFPLIATVDLPIRFNMSADKLGTMLGRARYAISTEETRYYLNGIYFHTLGEELLAVSTDGHRLARITVEKPADISIKGIIIPRKCIAEVLKIIDEVDNDVTVEISPTKIRFTLGTAVITSKVIDGTFPDYTRVIPTQNNKVVTVGAKELAESIDRVATIATERTRAVKVELKRNMLVLSVTSPDHGRAVEEVECDYAGDPLEIGFNARYFLEILNQNKDQQIEIAFADPGAPVLIRQKNGSGDIGVIMPMRI